MSKENEEITELENPRVRDLGSITSTNTSVDGYITADDTDTRETGTGTSDPWSNGIPTDVSGPYPQSEASSPRRFSTSLDLLASGESINELLALELFKETRHIRGRIKFALYLQRFFVLGNIVCIAVLLTSGIDTQSIEYHLTLTILIAIHSFVTLSLFILMQSLEYRSPWTQYQLSKWITALTIGRITLSGATTVISCLPLQKLANEGFLTGSNFYYVLLVLFNILLILLQLYGLVKSYKCYKILHVYKVAGVLPQLNFSRQTTTPRRRTMTEGEEYDSSNSNPRQGVMPLELRYRYIIRREPLFFDLHHASQIYGYFRKYLLCNFSLKILALAQICTTSLLARGEGVTKDGEIAAVTFSFISGSFLFLTSTVPVFTYNGPGIRRELRGRAYLNGVKSILQAITAILSCAELIEDDLNKKSSDHESNVEPYYLVITVIGWLSLILLILQIDVSWTMQSMINRDLDTQYRRSSLSSSRVSI